ncbi:hypothetical protein BDB00DRAFT_844820, partial [Zychaea mexicana]|uniref:uncharacterized protein n=1 Tax=Zychaea mexicana TaxID=64656 RepID=UPI0022FF1BF7
NTVRFLSRTEPEPNWFCISRTEEPRGRRLHLAILAIMKVTNNVIPKRPRIKKRRKQHFF